MTSLICPESAVMQSAEAIDKESSVQFEHCRGRRESHKSSALLPLFPFPALGPPHRTSKHCPNDNAERRNSSRRPNADMSLNPQPNLDPSLPLFLSLFLPPIPPPHHPHFPHSLGHGFNLAPKHKASQHLCRTLDAPLLPCWRIDQLHPNADDRNRRFPTPNPLYLRKNHLELCQRLLCNSRCRTRTCTCTCPTPWPKQNWMHDS